jgi:hypothetical protein
MEKTGSFLGRHARTLGIAALVIITLVFTVQCFLLGKSSFSEKKTCGTKYDNFLIFKESFYHLVEGRDLYVKYPGDKKDQYKYSPTFALLMAPLAVMPDFAGLLAWNLLNILMLFLAFLKLPGMTGRARWLASLVVLVEAITSQQNSQSNCLMAGMILFAFLAFENRQLALATLLLAITVYIKIYSLAAFSLFLLYPDKLKTVAWSLFWLIVLGILPLIVISFSQLEYLYGNWRDLFSYDAGSSLGISVYGWISAWFGIGVRKEYFLLAGMTLFLLPLARFREFKVEQYRLLFLASVLIWMIIFNPKAESPSYVIAVTGAVIVLFTGKFSPENLALFLVFLIFTVLSQTDLFPWKDFSGRYMLKAVPCILIWIKLIWDMMAMDFSKVKEQRSFFFHREDAKTLKNKSK